MPTFSLHRTAKLFLPSIAVASLLATLPTPAWAQSDLLAKALAMKPLQDDVAYDTVPADKLAQCNIEEVTREDGKGFLVTGESGQTLRWFVDTNADNKPDRWCYFFQGVETYREIDVDFDKDADEYRWLGTGGLRWGIDENDDRRIDSWRMISAEEVTSEVVRAAATRDARRFSSLLITDAEISNLKLGADKADELRQKIKDARLQFEKWSAGQNVVTGKSRWTHFGAEKPGIVPAGTDGAQADIVVYENVISLLETDGKPQQLLVGTLIQVGNTWRAVDLPRVVTEGADLGDAGLFFSPSFSSRGQLAAANSNATAGLSKSMERLVTELQKVDDRLQAADNRDRPRLHNERADILEKLIEASDTNDERSTWIKQFADTVNAASQTGEYPSGVSRLSEMRTKLTSVTKSEDDLAYVAYRTITAEYTQEIQKPDVNFPVAQKAFLKNLENFVNTYPKSEDTSEAMVQIAMGAELVGDSSEALKWYSSASSRFANTLAGQKAAGATARLKLSGNKFSIKGKTLDGKDFSSAEYTGSPVIIHYWASWCEPCKAEMRALKELQNKYAKEKLRIVGINVDSDPKLAKDFLKQSPYQWAHIYEPGGLDGKLAVGLGVFNLPVNVVVDKDTKVVTSGIHWSQLDAEIGKLVQPLSGK